MELTGRFSATVQLRFRGRRGLVRPAPRDNEDVSAPTNRAHALPCSPNPRAATGNLSQYSRMNA